MIRRADPTQALMVTEEIAGAHPHHPNYPLLPEDIVSLEPDGTWMKHAPGLAVSGFVLKPEQVQKLKVVWMVSEHLLYEVLGDVDPEAVAPEIAAMKSGSSGYDF